MHKYLSSIELRCSRVMTPTSNRKAIPISRDSHAQIYIGENVWIGANCVICAGVRLGEGSAVTAGAAVVKGVEPSLMFGKVPAKRIRERAEREK